MLAATLVGVGRRVGAGLADGVLDLLLALAELVSAIVVSGGTPPGPPLSV